LKKDNKIPEMDREVVHRILENAFEANNMDFNKIPLEVLASYSNYRRERFTLQRVILVIVLIGFMLMPLLFIPPAFTMEQVEDVGRGRPAYHVQVDTSMPVRRVTAVIDGVNMPVYEVGENAYSVQPIMNGLMEVTVTLYNDQSRTVTQRVETVDTSPPVLLWDGYENGTLNLYLSDEGLGINYEAVYAMTETGETIKPVSVDEEKGLVSFAYPSVNINIYIEDKVGNVLHLVVMLQE